MRFLIVATILISLTVYSYDPYEDERHPDSWDLGTPDNITKTEVIIINENCGCPK